MPIIHLSIRVELYKKGKSMKIDGENFDFTKKAQEIAKSEIVENSDKRQEILFNIFDKNKDSKLSQDEITETLNIFQAIDKEDETTKKKDEELSDDEILAAMKKLEETNPEFKEGKFELKEVKEMMVKFLKLNKSKAEAAEAPSEASSAAPTEASASDEVKPTENPKDYVVPEGQSFKQLLDKILEKQGKTEPSEEDYKKAEEQFRKDNPDIEIRERRGIKYLLVGSRVKVPVDFGEELCDPEVEIEKWKVRVGLSKAKPKTNTPAQAPQQTETTQQPASQPARTITEEQKTQIEEMRKLNYDNVAELKTKLQQFTDLDTCAAFLETNSKLHVAQTLNHEDGSKILIYEDEQGNEVGSINFDKNGKVRNVGIELANGSISINPDENGKIKLESCVGMGEQQPLDVKDKTFDSQLEELLKEHNYTKEIKRNADNTSTEFYTCKDGDFTYNVQVNKDKDGKITSISAHKSNNKLNNHELRCFEDKDKDGKIDKAFKRLDKLLG